MSANKVIRLHTRSGSIFEINEGKKLVRRTGDHFVECLPQGEWVSYVEYSIAGTTDGGFAGGKLFLTGIGPRSEVVQSSRIGGMEYVKDNDPAVTG